MNNKKNIIRTIKIGMVILLVLAIIIGIIIYSNSKKGNENPSNNLPVLEYTDDEAKEYYTKKIINYLDTFQGDFHIKYKATTINEDETQLVKNEEFSKKGTDIAVYSSEDNERIVITNENFYHISEESKLIYKFKSRNDISVNMDVLFYSLDDINSAFLENGIETLNATSYYFEEYKMKKDNTILVRYYFDENDEIKYIKAYKADSILNTIFEIEMLENRTYNFMFDLGADYEIIE